MQTKILIADGDSIFKQQMTNAIYAQKELHLTEWLVDGEQVLQAITKNMPDFVLLEAVLPSIDGISLLGKIASLPQDKKPTIYIMSSFINERILSEASEKGAAYFFQKPINPQTIIGKIKQEIEAKKKNENVDILLRVITLFQKLGIPSHLIGYKYLKDAAIIIMNDRTALDAVVRKIYEVLAQKYQTTVASIERSMRNAIGLAWNKKDHKFLNTLFDADIGKPRNAEFLSTVALHLDVQILQAR